MVNRAEEDDGPYHHTADEAKGPTRPQDGINLGDKDRAQSPGTAARGRQPPHVHALQQATSTLYALKRCIILLHFKMKQHFEKFSLLLK